LATVTGVIERVDPGAHIVALVASADPAAGVYFPAGEVSSPREAGVRKSLRSISGTMLKLSTVDGPPGRCVDLATIGLPVTDVVFYYGYNRLAQYHDVYQVRVRSRLAHGQRVGGVGHGPRCGAGSRRRPVP
jgi:hypothetical protein